TGHPWRADRHSRRHSGLSRGPNRACLDTGLALLPGLIHPGYRALTDGLGARLTPHGLPAHRRGLGPLLAWMARGALVPGLTGRAGRLPWGSLAGLLTGDAGRPLAEALHHRNTGRRILL